jgi:RNA polymerase sigma-70 factor (ECF subfamily)
MHEQADIAGRSGRTRDMNPSGGPTDDTDLVLAIATRRDRAAFVALFGRYAPRLKSWFMRAGTPADRAEDLAQETMLAVWRRADSYDPGRAAVSAWIFTIGRNQRIDALRRLARPLPDADDPSMAPPEPIPPDAALDAAQDEARLRAALRDLPTEQAEVIRLAYYEDRPHAEIERVLGIPLGTVKSRLRLALARLRARIAEPETKGGTP